MDILVQLLREEIVVEMDLEKFLIEIKIFFGYYEIVGDFVQDFFKVLQLEEVN